jgi:hypothetical protein
MGDPTCRTLPCFSSISVFPAIVLIDSAHERLPLTTHGGPGSAMHAA